MNLSRIVERWADFHPGKTAIHFEGHDIDYAELARRVDAATRRLAALGVRKGDRVAWLGVNHPEMLAALFALARLGGMLVPLNFRLAAPEHEAILSDCGAAILVVTPEFYAHAGTLAKRMPLLKLLGTANAPAGWFAWDGPLPAGFAPKLEGEDRDPVLIVYTSGTAGRPKGAVHTQEGIVWNAVCSTQYHDLTAEDHVLTVLPTFHVGGLCIQTLPALHAGASVTLHPRFDAGRWLRDVAQRRPTLSLLVPTTMKAVIEHPDFAASDLSSLRMMNTGSSMVPDSLFAPFHRRGVMVTQVYGATETGPVSIYLRREDALRKLGSAGKAAVHCEIRLVSPEGEDVPSGGVGEVWVRGKNVAVGYWNDPDNPALAGGWFKSGDLARRDEEGYYWIVGRSKDVIVSGGENIYPAELENVLTDCTDVLECTVVGVRDERWGETPVAAVVRRAGSALREADLLKLFEGRLARFKHPRRIVFLEGLPKNAMGKVEKLELQKQVK